MNSRHRSLSRTATRLGGWSLIVAAVGFVAVYSYLAATFGYPDVLGGSAADVLPKLLTLGATGRAVWVVYALLPLLLIPAAVGSGAVWNEVAPTAMRAATVCGAVAAVSMFLGLARWPTIHWELAKAYGLAGPDTRASIDAVFAGLNVYLGNCIGEFLGEIALNGFFILTSYPILITDGRGRWLGYAGMAVGAVGLAASLRNVTSVVRLATEVNNVVLPVWLVVLGVVLVRVSQQEPQEWRVNPGVSHRS